MKALDLIIERAKVFCEHAWKAGEIDDMVYVKLRTYLDLIEVIVAEEAE